MWKYAQHLGDNNVPTTCTEGVGVVHYVARLLIRKSCVKTGGAPPYNFRPSNLDNSYDWIQYGALWIIAKRFIRAVAH